MNLYTYSPERITILALGVPIEGVVEDSFVSLSRDAPVFSSTTTTDGRVVRTYHAEDVWTIRITLMNTSPSNDFFTKLVLLDRATRRGKFPLLVKDGLGSTLAFSTESWIEGLPEVDYSVTGTDREWVIKSSNMLVTIGGNEGESSLADDAISTITQAIPGLL